MITTVNTDVKIQLPIDSDDFCSVVELTSLFDISYKQSKLYHDLHLQYVIETKRRDYLSPVYSVRFILNPDVYMTYITCFEDLMNDFELCYKRYVEFKNFMYVYKVRCSND